MIDALAWLLVVVFSGISGANFIEATRPEHRHERLGMILAGLVCAVIAIMAGRALG